MHIAYRRITIWITNCIVILEQLIKNNLRDIAKKPIDKLKWYSRSSKRSQEKRNKGAKKYERRRENRGNMVDLNQINNYIKC